MCNSIFTTTYSTIGYVRGNCGHKHTTIQAAFKCLERDALRHHKMGGNTDRVIVRNDGENFTSDDRDNLAGLSFYQRRCLARKSVA